MFLFIVINTTIFTGLAILHFYWAAGGKKRLESSLPETIEGKKLFVPGRAFTIAVAVGLLIFAFITISSLLKNTIPEAISVYGNIAIGAIFLLRAIGDFKYVGFFKKVNNTAFAKNDTLFYSPLCILLSIIAFIISYKLYVS